MRRPARPAFFMAMVLALAFPLAAAERITESAGSTTTRLTVRQWSEAAVKVVRRLVRRQAERPAASAFHAKLGRDSSPRPEAAATERPNRGARLSCLLIDLPPPGR